MGVEFTRLHALSVSATAVTASETFGILTRSAYLVEADSTGPGTTNENTDYLHQHERRRRECVNRKCRRFINPAPLLVRGATVYGLVRDGVLCGMP